VRYLLAIVPVVALVGDGNLLFFHDEKGTRQPVRTPTDWQLRVRQIRANMEQVMGKLPTPTDLPLDIKILGDTPLRHYTRRHLTFVTEKNDRLPAFLLVPHERTGKLPAVLCLPGSSPAGKDVPAGLTPDLDRAFAHELACRGFVCLVLDYPVRHTREYATDPAKLGYISTTMKGIVNHRRGVDLLRSLPFVDREAIAAMGHSLGGHNALFLAVFDPRIKAIVTSCGFNSFAKYDGGKLAGWSSKYYMPRIKSVYGDDPSRMPFDFPEVLAALAPRPVFINAPLHDRNFEVSGVRDCVNAALPVYRDVFKSAPHLVVHYPDAGHTFPPIQRQLAYDFLDRHLNQSPEKIDLSKDLGGHWPMDRSIIDIPTIKLGKENFSISAWVHAEGPGDLVSQYDPERRRGFHLMIKSNPVTSSQANTRQLQFGIENNRASVWRDCGRPGKAILAFALASYQGYLYAGTCEPAKGESGRVYRYAGGQHWIDCGAPTKCNAVKALCVHDGKLYAGVGKYRLAGSSLPESENPHTGARIYRYEGGTRWTDCGGLPDRDGVACLVVFQGKLHASSLYKPAGFFRHEGGQKWVDCGTPGDKRVEALGVFEDKLYTTGYDEGHVYRYDGKSWEDLGKLGDNTQTYSLASYEGRLHVGTWPSGRVYRLDGKRWQDLGRLGEELEVMGMLVHNGRLLAGTLPRAEVYAYEGERSWRRMAQLDSTPMVRYRRAWTMAEHDGQVFVSTLPSGKVYAFEAGVSTGWEQEWQPGWHHVAAVRSGGRLRLHVDGQLVAQSIRFAPEDYDLDSNRPLRIGNGMNGPFAGRLREVRLYRRALRAGEVRTLARSIPER
jgi:dienelactone hydrolase